MKNITVSRQSTLFKLIAFLNKMPLFAWFIKEEYKTYKEGVGYLKDYNTFNDICTFCRHFIYSIIALFIYVGLSAIILYYVVISPIIYLIGYETVTGQITAYTIAVLFAIYLFFLVLQHICSLLEMIPFSKIFSFKDNAPEKQKEPGLFASAYSILSQKHHNFCNRIDMKDEE